MLLNSIIIVFKKGFKLNLIRKSIMSSAKTQFFKQTHIKLGYKTFIKAWLEAEKFSCLK